MARSCTASQIPSLRKIWPFKHKPLKVNCKLTGNMESNRNCKTAAFSSAKSAEGQLLTPENLHYFYRVQSTLEDLRVRYEIIVGAVSK